MWQRLNLQEGTEVFYKICHLQIVIFCLLMVRMQKACYRETEGQKLKMTYGIQLSFANVAGRGVEAMHFFYLWLLGVFTAALKKHSRRSF